MKKWAVMAVALLFGAGLVGAPSPAAAELKVGVSGYVKLDVQYSDKIVGLSPSPSGTPLDTNEEADNSQTLLDARQTRLRIDARDEVGGVKMWARVETDFFTSDGNALTSNSRHLRLRHAFVRGDHPSGFFVLAGQYWSLLMNDTIAQPNLVDFNGPAGQIFSRQPQLRAGWKAGNLVLEAAIEQHSLENLGAASVDESQGRGQDLPLFAGKVSWLQKLFQAEAAVALAKNTVILPGGKDETEAAWAAQISAQANFDPVKVFAHYQHLDGLGRLGNGDFPSAGLTAGSRVENVESDGLYVGAGLALTRETSLNAVYGWTKADENREIAAASGGSLEKAQSLHVNVLHKFWKHWQAGLEYRRFWVDTFGGTDGASNIVHGAIWFFF